MVETLDQIGSDKAELKKLLKLARDRPIHMAFALGQDGKAIVKLDKLKKPRALEKGLKDDAKGSRNHRFGSVIVDPEQPKVAKFVVNKELGGIARKLIIALRGTGYKKVVLVTEDGVTLEEEEGEEEEGEEEEDEALIRPAYTRPDEDGPSTTRLDVPASEPSTEPAPPAPDAAELTRTLSGLVRQMLGVIAQDPSRKAALAELATDAQASLKRNDLDQAAAGIEILRQAIADGADAAAPDAPADGEPTKAEQEIVTKLRKSRVAWTATRAKIDAELGKLSQAILKASDGESLGDDLENQFYAAVDPVLSELDETLADVLGQAADAAGDARKQLMSQAQDAIDRYTQFVAGNDVIAQLDRNPFVPLALGKTLTATLSTLKRTMAADKAPEAAYSKA